jgi:ATP-dependent Clp protease ATP-binding subunit ClpA
MPKINVYLPDDLATAVREAHLSVSSICQQALAAAVGTVGAARETAAALREPSFDPQQQPQTTAWLVSHMTARLRSALHRAAQLADTPGHTATEHLLVGILDEPDNLGAHVLRLLDIDIPELRAAAIQACNEHGQRRSAHRAPAQRPRADANEHRQPGDEEVFDGLAITARLAIAAAVEATIDLGHNFLGCEHLLMALAGQTDQTAGKLLYDRHVEPEHIRRSATAVLAGITVGYSIAGQKPPAVLAEHLSDIDRRVDELEQRLNAGGL